MENNFLKKVLLRKCQDLSKIIAIRRNIYKNLEKTIFMKNLSLNVRQFAICCLVVFICFARLKPY